MKQVVLGGLSHFLSHPVFLLRTLKCIVGLLLLSTSSFSSAVVENVYFAGFALAGDAAHSERAFPVTTMLLEERDARGIPLLESALWDALTRDGSRYPNLVLNPDIAASHTSPDALALAVVLDWENASTESLRGTTKLVLDLHAQIMIFDFATRQVLGSWPVAVQLIDVIDSHSVGQSQIESRFRQMYYGSDLDKTLFAATAEKLAQIEVRRSRGNYIRVVSVTLEDNARAALAEAGEQEDIFEARVANSFGKYLSENQRVPYIPYTKGAAVGAKMAARFASGEVYQLELPTPDYRVHLTVRGFKKVELGNSSLETAWAYGSYMHVKIQDYDESTTYLSAPFKFGAVKKVPAGGVVPDDWAAYQESLFSLINGITNQMSDPDRAWLESRSEGRSVATQLMHVQEIIERCR